MVNTAVRWFGHGIAALVSARKRSRRREKVRSRDRQNRSPLVCEVLDARLALTIVVPPPGGPNLTYGDFWYSPWLSGVEINHYSGTSKDVVIPESINGLAVYALRGVFNFNEVVTSVTLPSSLKAIWEDEFKYSPALKSISVDPHNTTYQSIDGVLFTKNVTQLEVYPRGKEGPYTIPTAVQRIREKAFQSCANLTSVTVPSSVQEIGSDAFSFCPALKSVVLQDGVKVVGSGAFSLCPELERVALPSSIVDIRAFAFYACPKLTRLDGPATGVTRLNATPNGGGGVRLTWRAPAFAAWNSISRSPNGALSLLGYRIQVSANAGKTWRDSATVDASVTTVVVKGLKAGTPYTFRVTSRAGFDFTPPFDQFNAVMSGDAATSSAVTAGRPRLFPAVVVALAKRR